MNDKSAHADASSIELTHCKTFTAMTWNVEGLARNIHNLQYFLHLHNPDFVLLSEPQAFACDIDNIMAFVQNEYGYYLNSPDKYDSSLPLQRSRASGGTMMMWKKDLDPYVTLFPPISPAALPIIFHPPGAVKSLHVSVYLPTCGLEHEYIEELSNLSMLLQQLSLEYHNAPLYIRGDFNTSEKNKTRSALFESFKRVENLREVQFDHLTYHHFVGNGLSDSKLDRILYSHGNETLKTVICKLDNPLVESHHDIRMEVFIRVTD